MCVAFCTSSNHLKSHFRASIPLNYLYIRGPRCRSSYRAMRRCSQLRQPHPKIKIDLLMKAYNQYSLPKQRLARSKRDLHVRSSRRITLVLNTNHPHHKDYQIKTMDLRLAK